MGDPPSDPESPYQQSSRRSQPQPLVPEEVLPVVDAQNLRSNQEMPTSRTNLWGMPQGASRTQPGDHMMFQPEAPQLGGREYPAFPSEFQQRTYLDEVGLQATHDAGLMLQQLQQDQGDLFQPLEAAYPEPQPDFLDPFNMYPREDLQFIQDTQHGPYIRDDPAAQFSPSELAFMPFGTEVQVGPSQFPCFEYALVSPCSVSQECCRGRRSQRPGRSPPQAELPKAVRLPPPRVFV